MPIESVDKKIRIQAIAASDKHACALTDNTMTTANEAEEIVIRGRLFKTAALRHEWCAFLDYAPRAIEKLRDAGLAADVFTFVNDICGNCSDYDYARETVSIAVLPVTTYEQWWDEIGFKARNKIRKGQKSGVEIRLTTLDDEFAKGIEAIYCESPVRQGRRFFHYGKSANAIKQELTSFLDRSTLVGAYFKGELVGFMKLFQGENVLRTVHIISTMAHREKCIMDILIAKAVELCGQRKLHYLHYGSWTDGGVGAFRAKHGFQRIELPRYFVPLNWRGRVMLQLRFHRPAREFVPPTLVQPMLNLRSKWTALRYREPERPVI
jgi:hypothetical protein